MELWAVTAAEKPLEKLELEDPIPVGSEVVVSVTHCGVCHSDLHFCKGEYNLGGGKVMNLLDRGVTLPRAPGHEVLGVVSAIGPDVTEVNIGDKRIIYPWLGCGECNVCKAGDENMCTKPNAVGVIRHGGFGSHVLVPHSRYLFDYGDIDPAVATTFSCSGITVYSAIKKLGTLHPDEPILLVGAGGVGFAAISMLQALGHKNIIVTDINPEKKEAVLKAGASAFIESGGDMIQKISDAAGGNLVAALDFVNNGTTTDMALEALGRGGKLVLVGVAGGEIQLSVAGMIFRPRSIIGSATGSLSDLATVIELAKSGKLAPVPVISMPKDQANQALEKLRAGTVTGRIVLE